MTTNPFWSAYSSVVPIVAGFVALGITLLGARLDADAREAANLGVGRKKGDDFDLMLLAPIVAMYTISLPTAIALIIATADFTVFLVMVTVAVVIGITLAFKVWMCRKLLPETRYALLGLMVAIASFVFVAWHSRNYPRFLGLTEVFAIVLILAGAFSTASLCYVAFEFSGRRFLRDSIMAALKKDKNAVRSSVAAHFQLCHDKHIDRRSSPYLIEIDQLSGDVFSFPTRETPHHSISLAELRDWRENIKRLKKLILVHSEKIT